MNVLLSILIVVVSATIATYVNEKFDAGGYLEDETTS